jgi:predicted GNAT family N-acyltransferase
LFIVIKPWSEAQADAFLVRHQVFIQEQGVPADLELDEFDQTASHALTYQGTDCIGTARLVDLGYGQFQIGRMAVLAPFRGLGIGKQILENLIGLAQSRGSKTIVLHAQVTALPFYEKLGFLAQGPAYEEAGIPHRNMMLELP